MDVDAYYVDVGERLDELGIFEYLLVRNAEFAVGLTRVDAAVGLGVDVGVDAQSDFGSAVQLARYLVHHLQLLDRLAVDGQNALFDRVAYLLVAFANAGVYYGLGVEARLDGLAHLVAARAVDSQSVFTDYAQQIIVAVGFYRVMNLVIVFFRFVNHALQSLAEKVDVIEIKRGFELPELRCYLSA